MQLFTWTWRPPLRLFGMPLTLDVSFILLAALLGYDRIGQPVYLAAWVLTVLVAILTHELGHALMARAFGLRPHICLFWLGGMTTWPAQARLTPAQRLLVILAGPGAGLGAAALVYLIQPAFISLPGLGPVLYADLVWVNLLTSIFNLLPILPLDGGRVVETLGQRFCGPAGHVAAVMMSQALAVGLVGVALDRAWWWLAPLGLWLAWTNAIQLYHMVRTLWPGRSARAAPSPTRTRSAATSRS